MSWSERLVAWAEKQAGQAYRGKPPRQMTEKEYELLYEQKLQKPPRSQEQIRTYIKRKNPVRWRRLQREFRWAQRQAMKIGVNPEDVRWII